jgi:ligand-binding sensor domain-containing protein
VRYRNGHAEVIEFKHTGDSQVEHLLVNSDGSVLGATGSGLIGWNQGKKQTLTVRNGPPCNSIFSMIPDNAGALRLSTQCGIADCSDC